MQQVWVIRTKKQYDQPSKYSMRLDGHMPYSKTDNPSKSGIFFETEKDAKRSLSRYDVRYRDDYEIVAYVMVPAEAVIDFDTERYPYEALEIVTDMQEACQ